MQIALHLRNFSHSLVDEKSCTRGEMACDETYASRLNFKLRGTVGRYINEDRQAYLDAEDVIHLPAVPAPVSIFIHSSTASKDVLQVRMEDRHGNPLYILPPLAAGASTSFGWTRTDDAGAAPYRLRLVARSGPGDHFVDYLVLPVADAEFSSGAQRPARLAP